jgi:pyruvate-formate lyase-activating enzyme
MKIAFVSANREKLPDPVVPIGLLYVMAATPEKHDKLLLDLCFQDDPLAELGAMLRDQAPDVVAIGMRNIQNSDYTGLTNNLDYYRQIIATVRDQSAAIVVLGGGGFSVMPRELMKALHPDYGIAGEGEEAFPKLIAALAEDAKTQATAPDVGATALSTIGNLHYFEGEHLVTHPRTGPFLELDDLAVPDRSLSDPRYCRETGIQSVQTKRGCALRCNYCTYPTIEGRTVRLRAPETVVDEMVQLAETHSDVDHFFVVDSVFNIPPDHAKAICRAMVGRGFAVPWTCYANPLGFDAELAQLMSAAGCVGMEIGTDSGCDEILEQLNKGFDTQQVRQIHQLCSDAGLRDCHTFLLGTPGETLRHVERTLEFIADLNPYAAIIMAYLDDHEAVDEDYGRQRRKLREGLLERLVEVQPSFPRWVIPTLNVKFERRLFQTLRRRGLRGPLWHHLDQVPRRPISVGPRTGESS